MISLADQRVRAQDLAMPNAHAHVASRYIGEAGRAYHRSVHAGADADALAIAASRCRKIQPLVMPDDRVIEFGAGMLFNLRNLSCRERVAFDVSDAGRGIARSLGVRFHTDLGEIERNYDVAICHHVLEHVADPLGLIQTMHGHIRTGGRLLIFVPIEPSGQAYDPACAHQHLYGWTPATLGNLTAIGGFEVESATIGRFGYERRLAPVHRIWPSAYHAAVAAAQVVRPVREVRVVARKH